MSRLQGAIQTMMGQLRGLGATQQLLIGSLIVLALMTFFLVTQYAGRREMIELLEGASAADQVRAAKYLATANIEHRVTDGKVLVPPDRYHYVYAQLAAAKQAPADASMVLDNLIEKQHWMMPKFQQDRIFEIAKQNHLGQIIGNWPGIAEAHVIISNPEPRGFGPSFRKPSAQVTVFTDGGSPLDQGTVDALAEAVAGANSGMTATDVSIIDGSNRKRFRARSSSDMAASTYLEVAAQHEQRIQDKLDRTLHYISGVVVSVNAQVDASHRERTTSKVLPKGAGSEQFIKSEQSSTISEQDRSSSAEPGTRANTEMSIRSGGGSGSSMNNETGQSDFQNYPGTENTREVEARGKPLSVFVTIGVPREYVEGIVRRTRAADAADAAPNEQEVQAAFDAERQRLEQDIANLVRTDAQGEEDAAAVAQQSVRVSMIPVSISDLSTDGGGGVSGASLVGGVSSLAQGGLVKTVVLGVLAAASLLMMVMMVRKAGRAETMPTAEELVGIPPALEGDVELLGEADEADQAMAGLELDENELNMRTMVKEINEMVTEQPTNAATLLGRWIGSET